MKKSIIAASLASLFSLPAIAQNDIQNPVWVDAVNPIELLKPTQPIEQTPTQPVLPAQ